MTKNSVYAKQLIPILKGTIFWGLGKASFLSIILNHINQYLRQQSLNCWEKFHEVRAQSVRNVIAISQVKSEVII